MQDLRIHQRLNIPPSCIEQIYSMIANIDSVKNSWYITKKISSQNLKRLTQSVIVTSTGASNRIEGNRLTDTEVEDLYKNLRVKKFKSRDEQEIAGYLECLEMVFQHYNELAISESSILQLHHNMMSYSEKDLYHRGKYKIGSNRVEAKDHNGNVVGIIFDPTPPYLVQKEMQELIEWYNWSIKNKTKHPLILIANFIFEYLAIHPFQDGNGRTSRLLANLMLLQQDYLFTSIISHEKIIEQCKIEYYLALNKTQQTWKTDTEDITAWLIFFLSVIEKQSQQVISIMQQDEIDYLLSEKQLELWQWAKGVKEFSRKDAISALKYPNRTIESIILKLLKLKCIEQCGEGSATRYKIVF